MIAYITGPILAKDETSLTIMTSGLGYQVYTTNSVLSQTAVGSDCALFTHLSVRETALELFGFESSEDRHFFELLIGISGIGPRSGLAIMNLAPTETLVPAIASGDTTYLTKVSGIGKKSAEKIVLELKDKLADFDFGAAATTPTDSDVIDALTALGYSLSEVRWALAAVSESAETTQERIREALKQLGGH